MEALWRKREASVWLSNSSREGSSWPDGRSGTSCECCWHGHCPLDPLRSLKGITVRVRGRNTDHSQRQEHPPGPTRACLTAYQPSRGPHPQLSPPLCFDSIPSQGTEHCKTANVFKTSVPQGWGPAFPQTSWRWPGGLNKPTWPGESICAQARTSSAGQRSVAQLATPSWASDTDNLTVWAIFVIIHHGLSPNFLFSVILWSQTLNPGFAQQLTGNWDTDLSAVRVTGGPWTLSLWPQASQMCPINITILWMQKLGYTDFEPSY